jgi:hypothetical protein
MLMPIAMPAVLENEIFIIAFFQMMGEQATVY